MKTLTIAQLSTKIGETVQMSGFVTSVRRQKTMQFVILYDHTGAVQIAHQRDDSVLTNVIDSLTSESSVTVVGTVVEAPVVKLGGFEIIPQEIVIENLAASPLPIQKDSALEARIDNRHLSLRYPKDLLTMQVQNTLESAMRDYWRSNDFLEIHSPKLLSTASESGAELFSVPYFNNQTAYLAQSPQFYKQMAIAGGLDRVFEIGPVFRANPSFTSRHDTEFTSLDMEIAWTKSHEDVMAFEEEWLAYALSEVVKKHGDEIEREFRITPIVPATPFPRITLAEAREILAAEGHAISHKEDLDPEGERMLSAYIKKRYGHEFVFVTDYPAEVRAFYHMRYLDRPDITMSFDLLFNGVEVTTGAQREHRVEKLVDQAKGLGINTAHLDGYFNFFRHGCPPHGGCGVGLTRILMKLLNRDNVREVTFLYRGPTRLTP